MRRPPKKTTLDIDLLRSDFLCDPAAGQLIWSDKHTYNPHKGKVAGRIGNRGYVAVKYRGRDWLAHVLIWAHVHGGVPELEIDHINRNPADNRLCNLRLVTRAENTANRGVSLRQGHGCTPIRTRRGVRYQAQIQRNGRYRYLGTFDTREEAQAAYHLAAKEAA